MRRYIVPLAALLLCSAAPALAQPGGSDEHEFMRKALQGDNSEVRLGSLAERQARDPGVRRFGQMLVRDHAKARMQAERVAARLHMRAPTEVAPEARDELQRLRDMRGREFDREFVRYMVDDHQKDVSDFRAQADGRGPAARLARQTLPSLEKHLNVAQDLQRRLG